MRNLRLVSCACSLLASTVTLADCFVEITAPVDDDTIYSVFDTSTDLRATITGSVSELKHVEVSFPDKTIGRYTLADEALTLDNDRLKLALSLGPEKSDAVVSVPRGENPVIVKAVSDGSCNGDDVIKLEGMDSGVRAVIIGISNYLYVDDLNHADEDANAIEDVLRRAYPSEDDIRVDKILDTAAVRGNILQAMYDARDEMSAKGKLIVYFSGHGLVELTRRSEKSYFVPHEGRAQQAEATMIKKQELLDVFGDIMAEEKIFIFDSCFAGAPRGEETVDRDSMISKLLVSRRYSTAGKPRGSTLSLPDNVIGLVSSTGLQASYEDTNVSHGIFTHFIIEAIENSDDRVIGFSELYEYAKSRIEEEYNGIQAPQLLNVVEGEEDRPFLELPADADGTTP